MVAYCTPRMGRRYIEPYDGPMAILEGGGVVLLHNVPRDFFAPELLDLALQLVVEHIGESFEED